MTDLEFIKGSGAPSYRPGSVNRTRIIALILLFLVALAGCKKPDQRAVPQAEKPSGRWVAQHRSPASAKHAGTDMLAFFSYNSISVVSPEVVFVAADVPHPARQGERLGVVVRTTDGGRNWDELSLGQTGLNIDRMLAIHFVSPTLGWAVGAYPIGVGVDSPHAGVLLKTTDGGASWTPSKLGFNQTPTSIFFADVETGWMGGLSTSGEDVEGGPSDILATTDGGGTWQPQRRVPVSIMDLFFLDKRTGWASGFGGVIYHTADGGLNWDSQRSGLEAPPAPAGAKPPEQFIIGSIRFLDSERGWAAARTAEHQIGIALGTTDGGRTWTNLLAVNADKIRDVFFVSGTEGWATVGNSEYVYHTTDGGRNWSAEPIEFEEHPALYRIGAAEASHVWAVGGGAIFYRVTQ